MLTRGTWAGGQKHGIVLWSSDTWCADGLRQPAWPTRLSCLPPLPSVLLFVLCLAPLLLLSHAACPPLSVQVDVRGAGFASPAGSSRLTLRDTVVDDGRGWLRLR